MMSARGKIREVKRTRGPVSPAPRSRTLGQRTATGPMPVWISRSGKCPWRTIRRRPAESVRCAYASTKPATSASTACPSKRRAPRRKTSVSGSSSNDPGWRSWTTVSSLMAYPSFVENGDPNIARIRRPHLIPSPTFGYSSADWTATLNDYEGTHAVPLMTIHKSKGLEYHTVVFVGLDDGAWWSFANDQVEGTAGFSWRSRAPSSVWCSRIARAAEIERRSPRSTNSCGSQGSRRSTSIETPYIRAVREVFQAATYQAMVLDTLTFSCCG